MFGYRRAGLALSQPVIAANADLIVMVRRCALDITSGVSLSVFPAPPAWFLSSDHGASAPFS